MSLDTRNLPISGGVLVAGMLYVGTSVFILGPLVAERSIEKFNWTGQCEIALDAEIEAQRRPAKIIPKLDCRSTIGAFMPELSQLCDQYGNPDFGGPASQLLRQQERLKQEVENKHRALAASQSRSRCDCATSLVAQKSVWAIHAGSLRLVTPSEVFSLSALTHALHSPYCDNRRSSR